MKKALIPILLSFILLSGSAGIAEAAALTPAQISAIIGLLRSFGADEGVVMNVSAALTGTGTNDGTTAWCHTFNTNLGVGSSGEDVSALYQALIKEGFSFGSSNSSVPEYDARFYTELTASAVTQFQEKYRDEILTPLGLKYGTGYVGKSTRAKLNALYGCGTTTLPPVSAGYLEIEPPSASIAVGGSVSMQAMYQPPMPKCPEGFACPQVMPARYPVVAEWTSSNPKVASVDVIGSCAAEGCPVPTSVLIKGYSNGTADIKASYKSPSGTFLTATAKVAVSSVSSAPSITSIQPTSGPAGTQVTLTGTGFNQTPSLLPGSGVSVLLNTIIFGSARINNIASSDGRTLTFNVPFGYGCEGSTYPNPCDPVPIQPDTYNVSVTNAGGTSNAVKFTVASPSATPSITVLSPNGGENWALGSTQTIKWNSVGLINGIILYLTNEAGNVVVTNLVNVNGSPGAVNWQIPTYIAPGQYKILIHGCSAANCTANNVKGSETSIANDSSDSLFSIVAAGTTVYESVKCVFNGSSSEQNCYTATDTSSSYYKLGCSGIGACVVDLKGTKGDKITWKSSCGGYAYTVMDGTNKYAEFNCSSASPSITVTYPDGGETLIKGQSYFIRWAQAGFASDGWIQLQLRDAVNSSTMVKLITPSVPLGAYAGSFNWTVPTDIPDGKYLLWATAGSGLDSLGTLVLGSDFSNAPFSISVTPAGAADASSSGDSSFAALLFSLERQLEELERLLNSLLP